MHPMRNPKLRWEILLKTDRSIGCLSRASEAQTTVPIRAKTMPPGSPSGVDGKGESSKRAVQRPPAWAFDNEDIL